MVSFHKPIFYTTPPLDPFQKYGNGSPADFWEQMEADLDSAVNILPENRWSGTDLGRINKYAAASLLGKALLYKSYHSKRRCFIQ